ncbi:MAG: hypothetical protein IPQ07_36630 [Myxococcales bacterium]|nr:hypothetical protein [Myxococcales bacterium]
MFRSVIVLGLLAFAGCGGEDTCGELTLELGTDAAAYPTSAGIGCEVQKGGWWDRKKDEAGILFSSSDLPAEAHVTAVMALSMVQPGVTLNVPCGVAGEAYTKDTANQAFLTSGTITVVRDLGIDEKAKAHVFQVQWDLEWLGSGTYRSTGESSVWFAAIGAL